MIDEKKATENAWNPLQVHIKTIVPHGQAASCERFCGGSAYVN